MQKGNNVFINVIKENYTFLLLLIGLVVVISIQGCQPLEPTLRTGNCYKIKDSSTLQTQACIATSLSSAQCAEIASQSGSSYQLVPGSSCLNFVANPDCGTDEINNKIGCYLDDGSSVNKFYPQANPPESPQPASLACQYGTPNLYKCDQGKAVFVEDCAASGKVCQNGAGCFERPACPYGIA